MKPQTLRTKIFLDSGDPQETKRIKETLGFLDGQTTNPSLLSKNPHTKGKKFSKEELLSFYQGVVREVSDCIPEGSVSIEVYANEHTSVQEMIGQGREMFSWIPNAHIKFPTTKEGLRAAQLALNEGIRVNMTLCFSQEQAAAIYAATQGAAKGSVFVSPFVGRLDDQGENGMDLVKNILSMYQQGDGHVEVLTASVRNLNHLLYAISLGSDILTVPFQVLEEWAKEELLIPGKDFQYDARALKGIPFKEIDLEKPWEEYDIFHELTEKGLERFSQDWNSLLS